MHRILVIEPHQILRHAFAVALSPEYQVETIAKFPEVTGNEPDIIIIDAAAFRERGSLGASELSAIGKWKMPVIWIEGHEMADRPESAKHLCLKWPLEKDALKKALAACLEKNERTGGKILNPTISPVSLQKAQPADDNPSTAGSEKKLIELVDIVES